MEENLGFSPYMATGVSFFDYSGNPLFPPSYYAGVLSPYSRQPVVNHKGQLYGKFSDEWNEDNDKMYSLPNMLEAIIRTSMSYHLGNKNALHFLRIVIGTEGPVSVNLDQNAILNSPKGEALEIVTPGGEVRLSCSASSDCEEYFCELFSYDIPMMQLECLMGVCVCPAASYHLALDPGKAP